MKVFNFDDLKADETKTHSFWFALSKGKKRMDVHVHETDKGVVFDVFPASKKTDRDNLADTIATTYAFWQEA